MKELLGATSDTDPFIFTITVSAGSLLIGTVLGLWLNEQRRKRNDKNKKDDDGA